MIKPTSILIITVVCMSGYYFLIKFHRTRFEILRSNGYHTFLRSLSVGACIMAVAVAIHMIAGAILSSVNLQFSLGRTVLSHLTQQQVPQMSSNLFDICAITFALSLVVPMLFYRTRSRWESQLAEAFVNDSESPEFTKLFKNSLKYGLPVLLTLDDRKVYIGYPVEIHTKTYSDVMITPMLSGYRDKDTSELVITTPYHDAIAAISGGDPNVNMEIFLINIPLRNIAHGHLFQPEFYELFKQHSLCECG